MHITNKENNMKGPKNAVPTLRGWINPKSGELLKSQKISQSDIDAWHGVSAPVPTKPKIDMETIMEEAEIENNAQQLNEAPANNTSLDEMNKIELEALGRQHGVELDRREKKSTLIDQMKNLLG
jgi:hypothetical protein